MEVCQSPVCSEPAVVEMEFMDIFDGQAAWFCEADAKRAEWLGAFQIRSKRQGNGQRETTE